MTTFTLPYQLVLFCTRCTKARSVFEADSMEQARFLAQQDGWEGIAYEPVCYHCAKKKPWRLV